MKYIIITPVFNEEEYLLIFINSIVNQTLKPIKLILVDDNSTDNSSEIIKNFADKYSWIQYIYHSSDNHKSQGGKVINAFNFGLKSICISEVDFISKIDADLELPTDYFQQIAKAFEDNPKLGICGGIIEEMKNNNWVEIKQASYHVRGALKSYRSKCFEQIEGLMQVLGWDGLDEMKAMYMGWTTKNINCKVKHFRPASTSYNRQDLNYKIGLANYQNGGNLFLAIIRSLVKIKQKPIGKVSISFIKGYLNGYINNKERYVDSDFAKFINKYHLKRFLKLNRY